MFWIQGLSIQMRIGREFTGSFIFLDFRQAFDSQGTRRWRSLSAHGRFSLLSAQHHFHSIYNKYPFGLSRFIRVRLFATQWTVACQAPLSMGFSQARILEWVPMPSSRGHCWPRDRTSVSYFSCTGRQVLCHLHKASEKECIQTHTHTHTCVCVCLCLCVCLYGHV